MIWGFDGNVQADLVSLLKAVTATKSTILGYDMSLKLLCFL